ncbi:oxidoreductase [Cryphonectria parasitica EP155]|uniref:Oxidoreductase n=1 Tax=Cryphonectria parasitica (strain ATCC 38755 / EP155) TaxID=660469 RepID=A0A9P4Y0D2_CRYP1|nr:oxidoreductase [Cryphonectria parasitica EP155]KAF3764080.1 oxidoreductase [Cryphonectria parasitica EP155]
MPRLFNGLWQLSSPAWGSATTQKQEKALAHLVENGLTAADMADHYGDAELVYGDFRNKLATEIQSQVFAATKWCVFTPLKSPPTTEWVLNAVRERCRRLGGRVELLQFHWYDYTHKEYLDILVELVGITKSHPELVSAIGLCNFDSEYTQEACEYLLSKTGSVGIVSNQVQFSLFDSRPLQKMCAVCERYNLKLLTYGSFCGGFLSQKWLGQPVPNIYSEATPLTPSQRKYFDMINNWGAWVDFQNLLSVLSSVAEKYNVSLTNVATRWVLDQPSVGAVIVGTRLGVSFHGDENLAVFGFKLSETDLAVINHVALGENGQRSLALFEKLGDCGHEYRGMH